MFPLFSSSVFIFDGEKRGIQSAIALCCKWLLRENRWTSNLFRQWIPSSYKNESKTIVDDEVDDFQYHDNNCDDNDIIQRKRKRRKQKTTRWDAEVTRIIQKTTFYRSQSIGCFISTRASSEIVLAIVHDGILVGSFVGSESSDSSESTKSSDSSEWLPWHRDIIIRAPSKEITRT